MQRDVVARMGWVGADGLVLVYALAPMLWLLSLSLKGAGTLGDQSFFPRDPTLENYRSLADTDFVRPLINSLGICLISTAVALLLGTMAAYAIARLRFPGKRSIIVLAALAATFPQIALVIPLFKLESSLGILDTWLGLVLPYVTFALPLTIYTLSAFFNQIPRGLERAAMMDGATPYQVFRKVFVPLARPGIGTTAILVFIACWNDFIFAVSLTSPDGARTVPAALADFTGTATFERPTTAIAAAAVLITLPILAVVLAFQRRIVTGLTAGAVRG
ncbi:MAG: carbohydrate ABC transporter permease [Marmoricola sp.]